MSKISLLVCLALVLFGCGKNSEPAKKAEPKGSVPTTQKQAVVVQPDKDYAQEFINQAKKKIEAHEYYNAYYYINTMLKNYPETTHKEKADALADDIIKKASSGDLFSIAALLGKEEDYEKSIYVLGQVLAREKKPSLKSDALYYMGINYEKTNRLDDLENVWGKIAVSYPDSQWAAEVLYGLGYTFYHRKNDTKKAALYFSKLYKNYPHSKWVLEAKNLEKAWKSNK